MTQNFKNWILATRPWSFPASIMPALVSFMYVFYTNKMFGVEADFAVGALAILGALIFHVGGNLISDYYDYKTGVDSETAYMSGSSMLINRVFKPGQFLRVGYAFVVAGVLIGAFIVRHVGIVDSLPLFIIGACGMGASLFYYKFKSVALGDFLIFMTFGPLIFLGVAFSMTGVFDAKVIWLALPLGFLTTNILHANNTRDIASDRRAGIKTQAMLLGIRFSVLQYKVLLALAYLVVIGMVVFKMLPLIVLITLLSLPIALKNARAMNAASIDNPDSIRTVDIAGAQLQLIFSLLFAVSLFISVWV